MTYKRPKEWYLIPLFFLSRCQAVDWFKQYQKYGVNAFDIRLFWSEKGELEFRHGLISYDASDLDDFLYFCNEKGFYVRVLFEERNFKFLKKRSQKMNLKEKFIEKCKEIEAKYPNVIFYGGKNTDTWETLYNFKNEPKEKGFYCSVTSFFNSKNNFLKIIDDWCPWFYAKLMNKKNMIKYINLFKNDEIILQFDFINVN